MGERALERVVAATQCGEKFARARVRDLEPAWVVLREPTLAAHDVQRCTLLRARLRQQQRAVVEAERERDELRRLVRPRFAPLEAARDHQMNHEPDVVFEADRDALAESAKMDDALSDRLGDTRLPA